MILITGGSGFLGSWIAKKLLEQGQNIRLLGRSFDHLPEFEPYAIRTDLRDQSAILRACVDVRTVVHAGALSSPWGPRQAFWQTNVLGTKHVLEGAKRAGARIIYISSPSVVFDGHDHHELDERAAYPKRLMSSYAWSKKLGEELIREAKTELETVILRPKAIFGPGDRSLLPRLIQAARAKRLVQIGSGTNRVDLTFVGNVAHAVSLAIEAKHAVGQTLFITNDEHPLLWELIRTVLRRLRLSDKLAQVPLPVAQGIANALSLAAHWHGREPMLTPYTVSILARTQTYTIDRAKEVLGYNAQCSITEGLEQTLTTLVR